MGIGERLRTKTGPGVQGGEHNIGKDGAGPGMGWGDVNKDGRTDIITSRGWWEQPKEKSAAWTWHGTFNCNPGDCSIGMPVYDVDGDGDQDIVFGSGHNYGMYWLEQTAKDMWKQHTIDNTWSKAHAVHQVKRPGAKAPGSVTGKALVLKNIYACRQMK